MNQGHDIEFYSDLLARHQYALVDRAVASAKILEKLPLVLLVPSSLRSDEHVMPGLLPLGPDKPYMGYLAECMKKGETDASENPVDTLLVVSPDIEQRQLELHLISRLIVFSQQGKAYLRYYSSDIFPHLVRILSARRLKSLFGPKGQVCQWTYRFQNEWIPVPAPDVDRGVPLAWVIRRENRDSLDIVGDVSQAVDIYQEKLNRPWKDHAEWDKAVRLAERSIGLARRTYHLSAPADLNAFVIQALMYGERIHTHPRLQRLLQDSASRPHAYRDATHGITNDEWVAMAAEIPSHREF